ncbi:CaiB/BaiF CoA transferase family protein [Limnohabitans lacus]|jgi:crotonobetainyl-CoA:carnitine CoA-transferase CaiB-like acyl-CoA transferase|uniref:CaiB/BaiF CoA-transferase family protein n=1 Tax=Limnohabitans lacus TaxID=3045173 RepID=A0ABT6X317_9BURK|nr:CaiB/BaiF CoA-transferase family protein [Limnohabitans sp. HM2-2]MDI9232509.1 CaiB/BaiF CoA-transferase family protein [Limnohabitans sp. HM2-2]
MAQTQDTQSQGPLRGVRILDLATVVAAPMAGTLCADMGAEVIKVELPRGGDALRSLAPVWQGHELFWKVTNRGKKGITLDVRQADGRALFLSMLPQFDVLIENFRTGTLDAWGLDIQTLHQHHPNLIVLRLTGFGQTGPYAKRPGFARVFEAMSGFTHLTGETDGPPQHMNYPLGDAIAGLFGAFSISTALAEKARTPPEQYRGSEIDLAATEALFRLLDPLAAEMQFMDVVRQRNGSRATYTAPSNVYQSADGHWITIVGTGNPIFERICKAMDRLDLLTDPRFANNLERTRHLVALDKEVADWCRQHSMAYVMQRLDEQDAPYGRINSIAQAAEDPHFQSRQALIDLPDDALGSVKAPCIVPRFVGRELPVPHTGPGRGEHNAEFYSALGLTEADLQRLRDSQSI